MMRKSCTPTIAGGCLVAVMLSLNPALRSEQKAPEARPPGAPAVNRVLYLDGESDFMRVPDVPSLHVFTNALTIETWFKASSFYPDDGQVNSLVRKDTLAGEEDFLLRFRMAGGQPSVEMSPGYHVGALQASHPFETGRWYHLAGTYDGSTITAYVSGARIGSKSASGRMYIDRADLYIGKGDPEFSLGEYFHGALDEIRLWNLARSAEQIQAAMNATLTGKEDGLVAYWNFDDGTTRDLSGHGHNGLLPEIVESPRPTSRAPQETESESAREESPRFVFHIWGSVPFSAGLTRKPLNQHILFVIRKDPKRVEEIARQVAASMEDVSRAVSQLAEHDLVRKADESRWVTNIPVFVEEEIVKAHEIGLRYARIEADILRENIGDLKTAYERCQASQYHPWSKTSLIMVGALCADFCVSDRIRFKPDLVDERFLPPLHPDGRRWGYWGEEALASPPPFRKYQFYQNVSQNSEGGVTRFGYYHLRDEKRGSPPARPENLHHQPEGKIWLSLTTPATLAEIRERTGLSPEAIQSAIDRMRTWAPPGVVEEDGRYMPSVPILSSDDLRVLLPEADRIAEIIFQKVTVPMEEEMEGESKRRGLRFPLPSGTSARDIALQILSEDGVIAPIAQPPVPWNFAVWGWNGHLAMWENM